MCCYSVSLVDDAVACKVHTQQVEVLIGLLESVSD